MYTPANAGPIAIPMNNKRAPTPTDIPMNDLGTDDTTMFHVAVVVIERPDAIISRLVDTANSVELNISSPSDPIRLIRASDQRFTSKGRTAVAKAIPLWNEVQRKVRQ